MLKSATGGPNLRAMALVQSVSLGGAFHCIFGLEDEEALAEAEVEDPAPLPFPFL